VPELVSRRVQAYFYRQPDRGRIWWAHIEFTPINITPTILRKKIEDVRESERAKTANRLLYRRDSQIKRIPERGVTRPFIVRPFAATERSIERHRCGIRSVGEHPRNSASL
jgi:NADPH-dependent glutamate synthase beta subunit-like oxidoreductase